MLKHKVFIHVDKEEAQTSEVTIPAHRSKNVTKSMAHVGVSGVIYQAQTGEQTTESDRLSAVSPTLSIFFHFLGEYLWKLDDHCATLYSHR